MQMLFPQMSGRPDFHAKMSHWRELAKGQGLRGRDLDCFTILLDSLARHAPELLSSKMFTVSCTRTAGETSEPLFKLWPNSGILSDGVCLTARTSESPNHASASTLWDVIETGKVPEKYFLSPSAARGMLRRAKKMGRNLFPPLKRSLEILADQDQ